MRDYLLQSLHMQLSTYLCFTNENIYNYEDPLARKLMLDSLRLRFSLVGGMFDSIYRYCITLFLSSQVLFILKFLVKL